VPSVWDSQTVFEKVRLLKSLWLYIFDETVQFFFCRNLQLVTGFV
jgi:hypothetical protein